MSEHYHYLKSGTDREISLCIVCRFAYQACEGNEAQNTNRKGLGWFVALTAIAR